MRAKQRRPSAAGFLLALVLLLGCTGSNNLPYDVAVLTTSEEGLDPATAAVLREAKRHAQTRVAGAAIGGAAGAVAGILGGQGQSGGARALMGGGLSGTGAALGYAFGEYIDARESRANMDQEKIALLAAAAGRDNVRYDQTLDDVERALERSSRIIQDARQGSLVQSDLVYRQERVNLAAMKKALQMFEQELRDNVQVMSEDAREAEDNHVIDPKINPAPLRAQVRVFEDKRQSIMAQRRIAEDQLESLAQRERSS